MTILSVYRSESRCFRYKKREAIKDNTKENVIADTYNQVVASVEETLDENNEGVRLDRKYILEKMLHIHIR